MGLFDKAKKPEEKAPEPAFPEPPKQGGMPPAPPKPPELEEVKKEVETPPAPPSFEPMEEKEEESEPVPEKPIMPELEDKKEAMPTLYLKLSEYKNIVGATDKMRKDVEKVKELIKELRNIEQEERMKLDKSEELVKKMDEVIALFEKTMIVPTE